MTGVLHSLPERDPFRGAPSFSLRHRAVRVLWRLTWALLAAWTPPMFRRWRLALLRLFGARLHPTANVYGSARIWYPAHLEMGAHATLGPGVICYAMDRVRIGAWAVVSQRAHLCCGTHDIADPAFQLRTRPIEIGAHAWICAEAFVGPGVTVGEGAVLSARAAAFADLAPWSLWRGNPAVRIGTRPRFTRDPFPGGPFPGGPA